MEYGSGAAARTSIAAPGGPPLPRTSRRSERAKPSRTRNQLLDSLGRAERAAVLADCEPMQLRFAAVLCEPGDRIRYAYFPQAGAIALIAHADRRAALEVGSVGNEGMFGFPLSWDEVARSSQAMGDLNTLPLELQGLTTTVTTPVIYALGTVTTVVSFLVMGLTLLAARWLARRRGG